MEQWHLFICGHVMSAKVIFHIVSLFRSIPFNVQRWGQAEMYATCISICLWRFLPLPHSTPPSHTHRQLSPPPHCFQTRENCSPNTVTFNSLITAVAQGGQWEKAAEVFEQMQAHGCTPDVVTYTALIAAFDKGGQWRLSLQVGGGRV